MNYCGHCGTPLEPSGRCPTCSAQEGVPRIVEQTSVPVASTTPSATPQPSPPPALVSRPAVEPTVPIATVAPQPVAEPRYVTDDFDVVEDDPGWRRSQFVAAGVIAAVLLLAGLGFLLWNLLDDEPDSLSTTPGPSTTIGPDPTPVPPPSTLPAPPTSAAVTLPQTTLLTLPPTSATVAPTTVVPATVIVTVPPSVAPDTTAAPAPATDAPPETEVPPATEPPPTAPPTTVSAPTTEPPPIEGGSAGEPQVLQDPLPSGTSYAQVQSAHLLAQQLADALAMDDWDLVRDLSPALADSRDEQLERGYRGLDRASLLLVDAEPGNGSARLLTVSVANERGSRTSLYCFQWASNPSAGSVDLLGGDRIARVDSTLTPQQVRDDPELGAAIRNDCTW